MRWKFWKQKVPNPVPMSVASNIPVECPHCGSLFRVAEDFGKETQCPGCHYRFAVYHSIRAEICLKLIED